MEINIQCFGSKQNKVDGRYETDVGESEEKYG
jgi:hypothetical protein